MSGFMIGEEWNEENLKKELLEEQKEKDYEKINNLQNKFYEKYGEDVNPGKQYKHTTIENTIKKEAIMYSHKDGNGGKLYPLMVQLDANKKIEEYILEAMQDARAKTKTQVNNGIVINFFNITVRVTYIVFYSVDLGEYVSWDYNGSQFFDGY